jgi:hypothetical protein
MRNIEMSKDEEGGVPGFGLGQPGQRETKQTGGLTEGNTLPVAQATTLGVVIAIAVFVLYLNAILIGPIVGILIGLFAILFADILILRYVRHEFRKALTENNQLYLARLWGHVLYWGAGIGIVAAIMWAVAGQLWLRDVWPLAEVSGRVAIWIKTTFFVFTIPPFLVPCLLLGFRMAVEIFNGNWPPPYVAVQPRGPFTLSYPVESKDDQLEEIRGMLQDALTQRPPSLPRPVPAYDKDHPNHNGKPSHDLAEGALETPDGAVARQEDVNELVMEGTDVGITYGVWKQRKGWTERYWRSLINLCAQHGLATRPSWRSKTRLLIQSRREAAQALDNLWRYTWPARFDEPTPPPESIGGENSAPVG